MISDVSKAGGNYPPYNISKTGDQNYQITLADAGFSRDEIEITQVPGRLEVRGVKGEKAGDVRFLHRGISLRPFKRSFILEENTRPVGATFKDGLLQIDLETVIPEEKKPRTIEIQSA